MSKLSVHRNRLGHRGIEEPRPGRFRAVLGGKRKWRSEYVNSPLAAARLYDAAARRRYGPSAYLNFAHRGENQVVAAEEDVCLRGHSRSHMYHAPDGRAAYCRACARAARRKAQRRSAPVFAAHGPAIELAVELRRAPKSFLCLSTNAADNAVPELATGKRLYHGPEEVVTIGNVEHAGSAHHGGKLGIGK